MSNVYISTVVYPDAHPLTIFACTVTRNYTITGSGDGSIRLWDGTQQEPEPLILKDGGIGIHHLASCNEKSLLAAVDFRGKVSMYDLKTLKRISEPGDLTKIENGWAVAIALDQPIMALATISGSVEIWSLESFERIAQFLPKKPNFLLSIDLSPDGNYVACGYDNGDLLVYNVTKTRLEYSFSGHRSCVRSVKFSPDGSFLAAAGDSKVIFVYQVTTGEHIMNLSGHDSWIFALDWMPDISDKSSFFLLSGDRDGRIRLWSLEACACVFSQKDGQQPVFSLSWVPQGWGTGILAGMNRGFVTVGADKTARWYRSASSSA